MKLDTAVPRKLPAGVRVSCACRCACHPGQLCAVEIRTGARDCINGCRGARDFGPCEPFRKDER